MKLKVFSKKKRSKIGIKIFGVKKRDMKLSCHLKKFHVVSSKANDWTNVWLKL